MASYSFLAGPIRPVATFLAASAMLIGSAFAVDAHIRSVAKEISAPAREVVETQLSEVLRRLDRIERKLDAPPGH